MATSNVIGLISSFPPTHRAADGSCAGLRTGCRSSDAFVGDGGPTETSLLINSSRLVQIKIVWARPSRTFRSFEIGNRISSKKSQICFAADLDQASSISSIPTGVEESIQPTIDGESSLENRFPDQLSPSQEEELAVTARQREPHPYEGFRIGEYWRAIQGEGNWEGLLDPLDPLLRSEIIRYGEFAQATYDAFDYDTYSRFCGSCKFKKENFFKRLYLENRGCEIVQYLYSTSDIHLPNFFKKPDVSDDEKWSKYSNWIGFVAVCTDPEEIARLGRRDVVVAWRGTVTQFEWLADLELSQGPTGIHDPHRIDQNKFSTAESFRDSRRFRRRPWDRAPVDLKVERGFLSLYMSKNKDSKFNKASAREQVLGALRKLLKKYEGEDLSITLVGHSLGGALATLCAYDIAELNLNHRPIPEEGPTRRVPITVYTFASPRVGNGVFKDRMTELNVKVMRVVNVHDFVPSVPGLIFNEKLKCVQYNIWRIRNNPFYQAVHQALELLPPTYSHVGVTLEVNNMESPFLKATRMPTTTHNLEVYLHCLDGFQGKTSGGSDPKLYGARDLALVNKNGDVLLNKYKIPPYWFQLKNRGLVRIGGRFAYPPREPEDFPEQPLHEDMSDPEAAESRTAPEPPH